MLLLFLRLDQFLSLDAIDYSASVTHKQTKQDFRYLNDSALDNETPLLVRRDGISESSLWWDKEPDSGDKTGRE